MRKVYVRGNTAIIEPITQKAYYKNVNTLYSFIIKSFSILTGIPKYVEKANLDNFSGIIHLHIKSPSTIILLILPLRSDENHYELSLRYPIGYWKGVYFSEEPKLALSYGYEIIEIYDG